MLDEDKKALQAFLETTQQEQNQTEEQAQEQSQEQAQEQTQEKAQDQAQNKDQAQKQRPENKLRRIKQGARHSGLEAETQTSCANPSHCFILTTSADGVDSL